MPITMNSGYTITVGRDFVTNQVTGAVEYGNLILTGLDGSTSLELLRFDSKSALELAQELIKMAAKELDLTPREVEGHHRHAHEYSGRCIEDTGV
jgi:sensor domain CHASE-containing protein